MKAVDKKGSSLFELNREVSMYYLMNKYKHNMSWGADCFVLDLRDSIWFRIMSLQWHCQNMKKSHSDAESRYLSAFMSDNLGVHIYNTQVVQYIYFDDIIYNVIISF